MTRTRFYCRAYKLYDLVPVWFGMVLVLMDFFECYHKGKGFVCFLHDSILQIESRFFAFSLFDGFLGNLIQIPYELLLLDSNYEPKSSDIVRTNAEKT